MQKTRERQRLRPGSSLRRLGRNKQPRGGRKHWRRSKQREQKRGLQRDKKSSKKHKTGLK
jgi:hypothetical protein